MHIVVWFMDMPRSLEAQLVEEARRASVGVHSISPLYAQNADNLPSDRIGLVMGYAALDERRIERGVHILAEVIERLTPTSKHSLAL